MSSWQIDDDARLAALDELGVLDSAPDPRVDALVEQAAALCATPVALVTLLARDRQWFKARVGTQVCETPIGLAICTHAVGGRDVLVIPDLLADPRTADNPLVTGGPQVRFYAGAPLVTGAGHMLGSLCVLDTAPRPAGLTADQRTGLAALAAQVLGCLEDRRVAA